MTHEVGEISVTDNIFLGYSYSYKHLAKQNIIKRLNTGDIGYLDSENYHTLWVEKIDLQKYLVIE